MHKNTTFAKTTATTKEKTTNTVNHTRSHSLNSYDNIQGQNFFLIANIQANLGNSVDVFKTM